MKKYLALVLTLVLALIIAGCIKPNSGDHAVNVIELHQYRWDSWGTSSKTIEACDTADRIAEGLKNIKETGDIAPKISDDTLDENGYGYPVEPGTMWINCAGFLYRLTPDLSQICLVETHFGEGKVLEITDDLKRDINNAWYYAPYDYYTGTYNKGDRKVDLKNVYEADSTVQIRITDIHIESNYDPQNTLAVELVSSIDQEITVYLDCRQSDDNLAGGDSKMVTLKKGIPSTVELSFGGWPSFSYWVYIEAANTKAAITIHP